jgi:hypothetical protein
MRGSGYIINHTYAGERSRTSRVANKIRGRGTFLYADKPFPVLLTFDLDGKTAFEEVHPSAPYRVTQGAYGQRKGAYRILGLLDRAEVKATFCIVGLTAER